MDGVSKESEKWGNELLHFNKEKHGKAPRYAGQKEEPKIPQAAPSHGVTSRGKSNEHSRKYGTYPNAIKLEGDDHD